VLAGGHAAMRRLAAVVGVLVAGAAGVALTGARGSGGGGDYRVDALFYNAAQLIPGQQVRIAGAVVGSVDAVELTPDRRARVRMTIDPRFGPFHADALCRIRPQSLIGERFVECEPGTPRAPELRADGGRAPTVPLGRNESPVDLDLVLAALRLPYRERLSLIVNELGTGLAGRPRELDQAIRLANPALAQTRRVLSILDADRARLGRLVDATDTVIAEVAGRRGQVQGFIDRAAQTADAVASRRGDLDLALRRLPPMLAELEPTARSLEALAGQARPVLSDLRVATPGIRALASDLGPLNAAARPALVRLADMAVTGRRAVRAATPVAALLAPVARRLPPVVATTRALLDSMRSQGVVEGLQGFVYFASLATARFDRYSHILPSYQIAGACQQPASAPVAGCSARIARGASGRGRRVGSGQSAVGRGGQGAVGRPGARPPGAPAAAAPGPTPPPAAPSVPAAPAQQLLDFLLAP
jgi:ABC-type transporter Mla subunit MlaD